MPSGVRAEQRITFLRPIVDGFITLIQEGNISAHISGPLDAGDIHDAAIDLPGIGRMYEVTKDSETQFSLRFYDFQGEVLPFSVDTSEAIQSVQGTATQVVDPEPEVRTLCVVNVVNNSPTWPVNVFKSDGTTSVSPVEGNVNLELTKPGGGSIGVQAHYADTAADVNSTIQLLDPGSLWVASGTLSDGTLVLTDGDGGQSASQPFVTTCKYVSEAAISQVVAFSQNGATGGIFYVTIGGNPQVPIPVGTTLGEWQSILDGIGGESLTGDYSGGDLYTFTNDIPDDSCLFGISGTSSSLVDEADAGTVTNIFDGVEPTAEIDSNSTSGSGSLSYVGTARYTSTDCHNNWTDGTNTGTGGSFSHTYQHADSPVNVNHKWLDIDEATVDSKDVTLNISEAIVSSNPIAAMPVEPILQGNTVSFGDNIFGST